MNKSNLFKNAWTIAKAGQKAFGGKVKEYFAEALKLAYKENQETAEIEIPEWIIRKNVGHVDVVASSVLYVKRETEKAILVQADGKFGRFEFWSPKSVLKLTNVTDFMTADVTVECKAVEHFANHFDLVEKAKELGIKGVSARMKSSTLRKKIAEVA